tara:strand:+ start:74 stop:445 length:372 start_codon:yes stop_codon:yes gene_type:complete
MDLSEYDRTLKYLPDKVRYFDEQSKEDKLAYEIEITWKHKYLPVSELKYHVRENHELWEEMVNNREQEILEIWMKELKYNSLHYKVVDKKIVAKGKVETQDQIDEWLKPNPGGKLKPITPETI